MAQLSGILSQGLLLLARQAGGPAPPTDLPSPSLDFSSYPTTGLQQFGFFIIFFFPAVSVLLVGLRLYDRATTRLFGVDDAFIVLATILAAVEAFFSFAMMKIQYLGVHIWQIPKTPTDPTMSGIINYIVVMLYNPELALVKSSVLFFLLRLGGHQPILRRCIHVLNWANIGLMIAVLFASIFTCVPVHKYWNMAVAGRCNNMMLQYLITSGLTVLTDILVLVIPVKIVMGLQLPMKLKAILITLLCSGIVVTIFSILRMHSLYRLYYPPPDPGPDPTYSIDFVYSTIECNLAIITASIPPLHGLMRKWFPRFFEMTSSQSRGYRNGYNNGYNNGGGSAGLQTIGGSGGVGLKDLRSPTRSQRARLGSLSNSEEEILGIKK
ncbi:uncharacterized protein B0H64DRAFT_142545 [Chaetomium fimeti]|uniref:Rhodopsin domain-containing protein n=1 Tax=Chaetomium fimeti TaxID=1854472 RepID=A0AAE0LRX0_9PEZI|nr:hypothetical protein B0H64DRAFT_142545 [Chaetomium fimeti]